MDNKKIAFELVKLAKALVSVDDEANELELYVENDSELYRQRYVPIIKNLVKKKVKGDYKSDLAVKLFMYLVEDGAKKYNKEFGSADSKWNEMFTKDVRTEVAKSLVKTFETEYELGNYDHFK